MSGGQTNQTLTSQAPSWQLPYQQYGLNQAQGQYNNVSSPTQLVAPFSPQQNQALSNINSFANSNMIGGGAPTSGLQSLMNTVPSGVPYTGPGPGSDGGGMIIPGSAGWTTGAGSPGGSAQPPMLTGGPGGSPQPTQGGFQPWAASSPGGAQPMTGSPTGSPGALPSLNNWVTNTLNGSPAQNPYLNSMFNQAADATQDRLASEFAGSGRNVSGSLPLRSDELNNLATSLYGGAYNTGVQQQETAAGMAPNVVNSELGLQQGLFNSGQQVQNQAQQYIQAPQNFLNQYLSRVNGNLGNTTTQPLYFNQGLMGLGGASLGGSLGNTIGQALGGAGSNGGNWGQLLGTLGGGLLGAFGG